MRRATILAFAIGLLVGLAVGTGVTFAWMQGSVAAERRETERQRDRADKQDAALDAANNSLAKERKKLEEQLEKLQAKELLRPLGNDFQMTADEQAALQKLAEGPRQPDKPNK